jgi:DNA-directed RNA polymerase specialized sigma24 family protein
MASHRKSDVRPPPNSRWKEWLQIGHYAGQRYARRQGRSIDDPDVLDYGQEVVTRTYGRFSTDPERYSVGDEFMKLVLGVMKYVAREKWRKLNNWRKLVTRLSQQWEEFVSSPDPRLFDWQEDFDLIVVPVKARSDTKTWEAFQLIQFEGMSPGEVANALKTTPQAVYSAKHNIMERFMEEESFLKLEHLLRRLWSEPRIHRAVADARVQCPEKTWPIIDKLYSSDNPGKPNKVHASAKTIYQARAIFLKKLEPILLEICQREEGLMLDD